MDWLRTIVEDPRTERFIMGLIVINAITLGIETSDSIMARFGGLLTTIDRTIIAIFVVEILSRLLVQRAAFFRDGWNIFDAIVVGIAIAPATEKFSVLRALRVLRLLRLITAVPSLQRVVGGLIGALPGMGSILLLIALVFYVCAVMAVNLYGKGFPDLFGTLGTSLYTLFILNLFIGIIVNAMQEEHEKAAAVERESERKSEREMIHDETAPLMRAVKAIRAELQALREEVSSPKRRP